MTTKKKQTKKKTTKKPTPKKVAVKSIRPRAPSLTERLERSLAQVAELQQQVNELTKPSQAQRKVIRSLQSQAWCRK